MTKKFLSLLISVFIGLVFQGNAIPERYISETTQDPAFLNYSWYNDPGYTDFTGSVTSVASELARLRSDYGGYTFSHTPQIGLLPFEWGYYSPSITAVIYSNLY